MVLSFGFGIDAELYNGGQSFENLIDVTAVPEVQCGHRTGNGAGHDVTWTWEDRLSTEACVIIVALWQRHDNKIENSACHTVFVSFPDLTIFIVEDVEPLSFAECIFNCTYPIESRAFYQFSLPTFEIFCSKATI